MGTQIQVCSQPGEDSTFSFGVEVPVSHDWRYAVSQNNGKQVVGYTGATQTLLCIDDRWENRSVLVSLLEPLGFKLVEAENGAEGLVKAAQVTPDLIITDLAMPIMDGYQFLKQLRANPDLARLKVIVSSASVLEMDQRHSIEAGGDDFLPKPIEADAVFERLQRYLPIEWQYESDPANDTLEQSELTGKSEAEIIPPPIKELTMMLDLTRRGRIREVQQEAQRIAQLDNQYHSFSQQILYWTKQFKAEPIEVFLDQHLSTQLSTQQNR